MEILIGREVLFAAFKNCLQIRYWASLCRFKFVLVEKSEQMSGKTCKSLSFLPLEQIEDAFS